MGLDVDACGLVGVGVLARGRVMRARTLLVWGACACGRVTAPGYSCFARTLILGGVRCDAARVHLRLSFHISFFVC